MIMNINLKMNVLNLLDGLLFQYLMKIYNMLILEDFYYQYIKDHLIKYYNYI